MSRDLSGLYVLTRYYSGPGKRDPDKNAGLMILRDMYNSNALPPPWDDQYLNLVFSEAKENKRNQTISTWILDQYDNGFTPDSIPWQLWGATHGNLYSRTMGASRSPIPATVLYRLWQVRTAGTTTQWFKGISASGYSGYMTKLHQAHVVMVLPPKRKFRIKP